MTHARWAVVVGNAKTHRNETLDRLLPRLRATALSVGGVIQTPTDAGQHIVDLRGGGSMPLGVMNGKKADLCSWTFDDAAFAQAATWIGASAGVDALTFVPVGRLEGQGKGHWPALEAALQTGFVVLVVSPTLLPRWALTLPDPVAGLECPADDRALDAFVAELVAACAERPVA